MDLNGNYDAVIVGSGPNGLAAAITLAREGWSVLVLEAKDTIGGGMRSAQLTLPGFTHDVCSAIYPLSVASPFLRSLPLEDYGLEWIHPDIPVAHPLDNGQAVLLQRSLDETVQAMDEDGNRYRNMIGPFVDQWEKLVEDLLGPLPLPPRHPILLAQFSWLALRSATGLAKSWFRDEHARALFAGNAAHSILPLDTLGTAAFGVFMSVFAHTVGWPLVRGGAQNLADAMVAHLRSLGGVVITNNYVESLELIPPARVILLDVTPRQFIHIGGSHIPSRYEKQLQRYRYGAGVFKIDYALDNLVPWSAPECSRAATVHLGGTLEEIRAAEAAVGRGKHPERPFVLFVQQSSFDASRAPEGKQTAWAYCHVPNGSTVNMTRQIEDQIERFAPGFRDLILARHTYNTTQMMDYNPNYIGGDIIGGLQDLRQQFFRPNVSLNPYATPIEGVYLCSSSTPPGGGVHGMCGFHAAQAVLRKYAS